jgi:cysteine desulfurase
MIYLDYAANTKPLKKVLKAYDAATLKYWANPNSNHKLGVAAKKRIDLASKNIGAYFNVPKESIIYTSGSSEANNLVIKGFAEANHAWGNKIIISEVEHSSIIAPCNYLSEHGYDVIIIPLNDQGIVDLKLLKEAIDDNTILVSICSVDSELGIVQPIKEIVDIVKKYPHCALHTDATQAIGKVNLNYDGVDFITFAPHKLYGLNGVGVLVNRQQQNLMPLIHGGKSTTKYRSGTPVIGNIVATEVALKEATKNLAKYQDYLIKLNKMLRDGLANNKHVHINSTLKAIPQTLNISLIDMDAKKIVKKLANEGIYLSTTSACSLASMPSRAVFSLTKDSNLASNSIRISISYLTTVKEIKTFLNIFNKLTK